VILVLLLNAIRGVCSSFFAVVSKVFMADLTPAEQRFRVFSNRYLAGNIGYAIGPILGASLGIAGNVWAFLIAALVYLVYFVLMAFMIRLVRINTQPEDHSERVIFGQAWIVFLRDRVLLLFIIGSAVLTSVYGKMSVTLSQYLLMDTADGGRLFGYLMSINGLTVLLTQVFITRWSERYGLFQRIALGCCLFAAGEIGFSLSTNWAFWVISMVVFTFGEILMIPSEYAQVDEITPVGMRGMYYGAQSFSEIGNVIGPWFGGVLLEAFGGRTMFLTMALLCFIGLAFYTAGRKKRRQVMAVIDNGTIDLHDAYMEGRDI
jgi:MFS family permease